MKILAIIGAKGIPKEFPGTSGVEAYIEHQIPKLTANGTVYCYVRRWANPHHATSFQGARLITLPSINTVFFDTLSYSLLASVLASIGHATVVWYHGIGPAFFSFIPKIFGKEVRVTVHSLDWNRRKWNFIAKTFLRVGERVAVYGSDTMYVVSNTLQKYYKMRYNKTTLLDRIPTPKYREISASIIKKKYGLKKNGYVLYMGRFVPEKRIEWLIRASNNLHIPVVLAGESSHTDGYVQQLRKLSKNRKIIFTGYVFGREKAELLSNCRLFVLPSALEGYPVVITEALGYRRPCLISNALHAEYAKRNTHIGYFQQRSFPHFLQKLTLFVKKTPGFHRQKER